MASALEVVEADDYVEYFLFPDELSVNKPSKEVIESLNDVFSLISCTASEYKHGYIWHKDPFNVAPVPNEENEALPPHLHGTTHFGDNIEDEWFIVFLLIQLTKDIEGLVVRVVDSDGEFLLIEAADHLPPWADPETCGQRVYLYQGNVHFIPFPEGKMPDGKSSKIPSVTSAIHLIRTSPQNTVASQATQEAILARIKSYPGIIKENLHRATLSIPIEIAALLKENPSLIAPAVRAFCERDPIDKRACRIMANFRPENCVMSSVLFTRCLYAMLSHEKAVPEKRSGWVLPPSNSSTFKMFNLGYKVACGFEILIHHAKTSGGSSESSEHSTPIDTSDLCHDRGWLLYYNSLKKKGYFKDLLEGSKEHNALLEKAKEFYVNNCTSTSKVMPETSAGHEILSRLRTLKFDLEAMKEESRNLPKPDDDSWLEISPEEVDSMLKARYGPINENLRKDPLTDQKGLATVLDDFLEYMSGMEGAEFPKPGSSKSSSQTSESAGNLNSNEKLSSEKFASDDHQSTSGDLRVNFDPDGFSCAVQNILDFAIPEDSWDLNSTSGDSDIGSYEDDGEMDLNELKPGRKVKISDVEIKHYMDQMDRELANTTLAESFEKKSPKSKAEKKNNPGTSQDEDTFSDVEDFQPVDIDMNALKNILESYQSQMGAAGPASNLLGPMGVHLDSLPRKLPSESNTSNS